MQRYRRYRKLAGQTTSVAFANCCLGLPKFLGIVFDMATWSVEAVTRLGAATKERRDHLGLTQLELWERGGPSNSTQTGIESATTTSISNVTLRKLDKALDWPRGTALSVLTEDTQPANLQSVPLEDLLAELRRRVGGGRINPDAPPV